MKKKVFDGSFENNIFTIIFGLLMGILTISFVLWNRVLRERLPRQIESEIYSAEFWFVLILFLYFLSIIIYKIYKLQKAWRGIKRKNFIVIKFMEYLNTRLGLINFLQFIVNYVSNAPLFLWRFLYFNVPEKYKLPILEKLYDFAIIIIDNAFNPSIPGLRREIRATIAFSYVPRAFVFFVFIYEIIINKELRMFYYVAILLLIPLIFDSITRIFMDLSYFELQRLENTYFKILCEHNNEPYDFSKAIEVSVLEKDSNYGSDSQFIRTNFKVSIEAYEDAISSYQITWQIQRTAYKFFIIRERYDYIASLITYILLTGGLFFWLLAIYGVY